MPPLQIEWLWALTMGTSVLLFLVVIVVVSVIISHRRMMSAQKDNLKVIQESEKKYRNLVESINDGVFVVNRRWNLLFANSELVRLMDIPQNQFNHHLLQDIFHGEGTKPLYAGIERTFQNGKVEKVEYYLSIRNKVRWFETVLIPQYEEKNIFINVLGISRDITERKALEKKQQKMVATLKEQQETLRLLSKEVLRAQEEERTRISREIHDEIGQALTAVTLNLELVNKPSIKAEELRKRIAECKKLVELTIENTHRFAYELRPTMLDDLGLMPAFHSHARAYRERTGIGIQINGPKRLEKINDELKTVLYRIFQESLNNVAKHARASEIVIDIGQKGNRVQFRVRDDGVGFNPEEVLSENAKSGGLGIKGIQERVELIGGKFNIRSKPGKGTILNVAIPFGKT